MSSTYFNFEYSVMGNQSVLLHFFWIFPGALILSGLGAANLNTYGLESYLIFAGTEVRSIPCTR